MGTFAEYSGDKNIPLEKKVEFEKAIIKLFYYGGMMNIRQVNMFDKKLTLLEPVRYKEGKGVNFYYNYYEDAFWEKAGICDEQRVYSNKVGTAEFCDVMLAAYCLYEQYDEPIGFVKLNGNIINCEHITGWINNILRKEYSIKQRFRFWKNAEKYALDRLEYSMPIDDYDIDDMLSKTMRKYAGGTELADVYYVLNGTSSLTKDTVVYGTYPSDVLTCKKEIEIILVEYGEEEGMKKVLELLKKNYEERELEKDELIKSVAKLSLEIPARVFCYLTCELLKKPFWKEWVKIKDAVYNDEKMKSYASQELEKWRKEGREVPIKPISTSVYLKQEKNLFFDDMPDVIYSKPEYYLTDRDRLYWWDGSDEVVIDEDAEKWLLDIRKQFDVIMEEIPEEYDEIEYLKVIVNTLSDINERYRKIYAFYDMFNEFIANGSIKEYRAAIRLLTKLHEDNAKSGAIIEKVIGWDITSKNIKCNDGRMNMKRYLSLLANNQLRMKYLGF